jgi:signal transduction histidine kinase
MDSVRKQNQITKLGNSMNAIYRTEEKMTGYTSLATEAVYQEMKESTSELHSTFARNVSHELRTPLAILYGYAEMLATGDIGELTSDQHHAVKTITDHARVLSKLVERIDVLLAIESHLTAFLPLTFAGLVAQVLDEKRPLAEQAEIVLETQVDPDTPFVWGDPQQLRQAVECLVENALKFTPRGGRVSVQLYTEAERVYLVVADTGIGMASRN